MKKTIIIASLMFLGYSGFSQAAMSDGKNQLNLGIGLSGWGIPVYVGIDHGLSDVFSLGGEFSFRNHRYKDYDHTIYGVLINGNYHFNRILDIPSEWDLYLGLNIGFYRWNSPSRYDGRDYTGARLGMQLGGRYAITSGTSLNLELGGGNALTGGKFGVTFNL